MKVRELNEHISDFYRSFINKCAVITAFAFVKTNVWSARIISLPYQIEFKLNDNNNNYHYYYYYYYYPFNFDLQ